MHSPAASKWALTKFSYSSFRVGVSDISWSASNFFLSVNVYLSFISPLLSRDKSFCAVVVVRAAFLRCCNEKNDLPQNPKLARTCSYMWSTETFLRVRVRFVERRDAFMQNFANLDRDKKNSIVGVASSSPAATKREREVTYSRTWFFTKITNRSYEWGETYGRACFLLIRWPIGLASERDRQTLLVLPRFQLVTRRKRTLNFFFASVASVVTLPWQFGDRRTHPRKRNMPSKSMHYYSISNWWGCSQSVP